MGVKILSVLAPTMQHHYLAQHQFETRYASFINYFSSKKSFKNKRDPSVRSTCVDPILQNDGEMARRSDLIITLR